MKKALFVLCLLLLAASTDACQGEKFETTPESMPLPQATDTLYVTPTATTQGTLTATVTMQGTPTATSTYTVTRSPSATVTPTPSASATPLSPTPKPSPKLGIIAEVTLRDLPAFGHGPSLLAFADGRLYALNMGSHNVSVVQGDKVIATISTGASPGGVAVDPQTGELYVLSERDNSVTVLSGKGVLRTLRVPAGASELAWVDGQLVVGSGQKGELTVIDGHSGEIIRELSLGGTSGVIAMAVDARSGLLLVNLYDETYVVNARSWSPAYRVSYNSYMTLLTSPKLGRFYLNDYETQTGRQHLVALRSADGASLGRVPIGGDPRRGAINARTGRIYVPNSWTNDVTIIQEEPFQVLTTVRVGLRPWAVAVDEAANRIYVANAEGDNLAVLDGETNQLVATIPLAISPQGVAVDPNRGRAYVANPSTNSVFVLEGGLVRKEIPVGLHPTALALAQRTGLLYVANQVDGTASIIDVGSERVVREVEVGEQPQAAAVDEEAVRAYVGTAVLDGRTHEKVGQISLQAGTLGYEVAPQELLVESRTGRTYVIGFNGIPGSNGGDIVYVLDESLAPLARLEMVNTFGMALDPEKGKLYTTAGRFGRYALYVYETANYKEVARKELAQVPGKLALNPRTGHLFIGLGESVKPGGERPRILVLDAETLADVASLPMAGKPGAMAVDPTSGLVYVCDGVNGQVTIIQDAPIAATLLHASN